MHIYIHAMCTVRYALLSRPFCLIANEMSVAQGWVTSSDGFMQIGTGHMGAAFLQWSCDRRHFAFVIVPNLGPSLLCFGKWLGQTCLPLLVNYNSFV